MKKTRVYLAGKIGPGDWRTELLETRSIEIGQEVPMNNWMDGLTYVGPYFIGCDHGCAHGRATHGQGDNCTSYGNFSWEIMDQCLSSIRRSDIVFAWINSLDCYGTLVELGYAHAYDKYIVLAISEGCYRFLPRSITKSEKAHNVEERHELWFAESIANQLIVSPSVAESFEQALLEYRSVTTRQASKWLK